MASTAATVFFRRPGRMSRRAELTGSFVGAGVVCPAAEAASNSKAGITKVVFILSSSFFGESGGLPQPQFPGTSAFKLYNHSNACQYSISFASCPLVCPVGHSVIATPIRSWRCPCSRNICREKPAFAGKVTCGVRRPLAGSPFGHSNLIPVRLYRIDRNKFYLFKRRYDHFLGRNRWLRDCAYGQADPGNERSYGEEAEVHVFLSPVIIRKKSAGG